MIFSIRLSVSMDTFMDHFLKSLVFKVAEQKTYYGRPVQLGNIYVYVCTKCMNACSGQVLLCEMVTNDGGVFCWIHHFPPPLTTG